MRPPTKRQLKILAAIRRYWRDHGRSPSIRDIGAAVGIGCPNGVVCHLRALKKKGLIEMLDSSPGEGFTPRAIWPAGLRQGIAAAVAALEAP